MLDHYLPGFRAGPTSSLSRMTSRATIRRRLPQSEWVKVDGFEVPTWRVTHTDLPFRLDATRSSSPSTTRLTVGGVKDPATSALAHLPYDTRDLEPDDLLEVTVGEWPGTVWRLLGNPGGDQKTSRRVPIVAAQRPKEW